MSFIFKVNKGAKIRNRYNQVQHLTQDTNGKVTNSQLYTTNESQEVRPFSAGDHKAHINRCVQRHSKHKTKKNAKAPLKKNRSGTASKIFHWRAETGLRMHQPHPKFRCGSRHKDARPARKTPNPPTHHPPEHTNQDTKSRQSKDPSVYC